MKSEKRKMIIRLRWDRKVNEGEVNVKSFLDQQPVVGELQINIAGKGGPNFRKEKTTMIAVKYVLLPLVSFIFVFILLIAVTVWQLMAICLYGVATIYWPYPEAKLFHPFPAIKAAPTEPIYLTILFHPWSEFILCRPAAIDKATMPL